jgi:hypothetical protein
MSNVVSLQCARERAWQPRGGSNGHAFKELGQSVWKSKTRESVMGELRAIRDCLSGLKRKMHSFERVWSSLRSRFKHCAIVPEH